MAEVAGGMTLVLLCEKTSAAAFGLGAAGSAAASPLGGKLLPFAG